MAKIEHVLKIGMIRFKKRLFCDLLSVRLLSHHMCLLGVLQQSDMRDTLVFVDFDYTK